MQKFAAFLLREIYGWSHAAGYRSADLSFRCRGHSRVAGEIEIRITAQTREEKVEIGARVWGTEENDERDSLQQSSRIHDGGQAFSKFSGSRVTISMNPMPPRPSIKRSTFIYRLVAPPKRFYYHGTYCTYHSKPVPAHLQPTTQKLIDSSTVHSLTVL